MPGIRTSRGLFLEVLEPSALVGLPLEFDVYDGANPASMLATLEACFNGAYQSQINEVGSGRCSLLRSDPKATAAILAKGNLVRVKTGGVYRGAWWIEEPTERLTSTQEASGEIVEVKGRGALAYLERGVVYPPVWPTEPTGYRSSSSGANATAGANTVVCPKPSGMVNTDTMIAAVAFAGGSGKAITPPPGWREIRREDEGTGLGMALFRKTVGSSEPASYSWAFTSVTQAVVNIVCLFNASPDYTVYGYGASSSGSGTAIRHPSLAVEVVDGILLTFAGSTAGSGMTPPGGYTEAQDRSSDTGRKLESAYKVGPALGDTGEVTTTNTTSGTWIGMHLYIPSTASNDATFTLETMGAILATLIDRAKARGSLPVVTYDFSATVDSQGNPWTDTFDLTFHAGTSLLDVWRHLVSLGMEGQMTQDLKLQAFQDMSREKGDAVILRKGYHFLGDVENSGHFAELRTRFLVEGAGGRLVEVTNPTLEADPRIGRREGFLSMATSDSATDLARAGEQALALSVLEDASRSIPVDHGLLTDGRYEPWEEYRLGDYIGLDADGTGIVTRERVVGITVSHREALDYNVELDLNSVSLEASVRMRRQLDALSRSSSGGGSGSSGLSLGGSGGSGGAGGGTVAVAAQDTPAFLLDKIDARGILRKILGGVPGNRMVQLDTVITPADLGTGTPNGSKFLRDDGTWQLPPGGGGGPALDRIWTPRAGYSGSLSDEFDDASIAAAWSRIDVPSASHLTWTEDGGVLSAYHDGADSSANFHALIRPLNGMTFPVTVETACRWNTPYAYAHLMLGPVFSDSAGVSGTQLMFMPYTSSDLATAVYASLRRLTSWQSQQQDYGSLTVQGFGAIALFWRIRWTASNTFTAEYSVDGVTWIAKSAHQGVTASFTPTHVGLILSTWGQPSGQQRVGGTYEHFRVYNS